jgi:sugar/nucleoside kinase (ribokinase family)
VLRFAAACGALAATRVGSFAAMPTRDAVERFLEIHA